MDFEMYCVMMIQTLPAGRQQQTKHVSMATDMLVAIEEIAGNDVFYVVHAKVI
jgi:hypothetical protein